MLGGGGERRKRDIIVKDGYALDEELLNRRLGWK
jgi:hypothetical protein